MDSIIFKIVVFSNKKSVDTIEKDTVLIYIFCDKSSENHKIYLENIKLDDIFFLNNKEKKEYHNFNFIKLKDDVTPESYFISHQDTYLNDITDLGHSYLLSYDNTKFDFYIKLLNYYFSQFYWDRPFLDFVTQNFYEKKLCGKLINLMENDVSMKEIFIIMRVLANNNILIKPNIFDWLYEGELENNAILNSDVVYQHLDLKYPIFKDYWLYNKSYLDTNNYELSKNILLMCQIYEKLKIIYFKPMKAK